MGKPAVQFNNPYLSNQVSHATLWPDNTQSSKAIAYFTGAMSKGSISERLNSPIDANGWRMPTPLNGSLHEGSRERGAFERKSTLGGKTAVSTDAIAGYPMRYTSPSSIVSSDQSILDGLFIESQTKVLDDLRGLKVSLAVAFAERKKTASLVTQSALKLLQIAKCVKSGRCLGRNKPIDWRDFPDAWLAYRYGWTPLVLDTYGAVALLQDADNGSFRRYRLRARRGSKSTVVLEGATPSSGYLNGGNYSCAVKYTGKLTKELQNKVRYDFAVREDLWLTLQQSGVDNPAAVVWELLPYSFVVDWFINVGDWLNHVNTLRGYTFVSGCRTDRLVYHNETTCAPSSSLDVAFARQTEVGQIFKRSLVGAPTVSLQLKRNPLNLTRLADALSLLSGFFKRAAH